MSAAAARAGRLGPLARARLAAEVLATYRRARRAARTHDLPTALAALRVPRDPTVEPHDPARLARAVQRTFALLPTDTRCLMRSLVLVALLARRGRRAMLVIGVQPGESFGAHAWVELDGRALLPVGEGRFGRLVEL